MALLKIGPEEAERMAFLELQLAKALMPYRENTEAALAVFAAIRVAQRLIRLYPTAASRADIIEVCIAYLVAAGEDEQPETLIDTDVKGFVIQ